MQISLGDVELTTYSQANRGSLPQGNSISGHQLEQVSYPFGLSEGKLIKNRERPMSSLLTTLPAVTSLGSVPD